MSKSLNSDQIRQQSLAAYNQWKDKWRAHAKHHAKYKMHNMVDLFGTGIGRALALVGNGYSFERDMDKLKGCKADIMCCDKTLGHLLDNGITPTYCVVADAVVDFQKYCEPWKDKLKDITLIMNVCGNPEWSNEKWKKMFFFANKDILESEKEFVALSGCPNVIPAATNVTGAMVVLCSRSDNTGRKNFLGYDKYLLSGFDYSWLRDGKYYAFDENGGGKFNYMQHIKTWSKDGNVVYTSNNLDFSCKWLNDYINNFKLPVINCSKDSVMAIAKSGDLEDHINHEYKPEDANRILQLNAKLEEAKKIEQECLVQMKSIENEHFQQYLSI